MDFDEQLIGKNKFQKFLKKDNAPLWRACTAYAFTKIGSFDV